MSSKLITGIIIGVVVVGGGFYMMSQSGTPAPVENETGTQSVATVPSSGLQAPSATNVGFSGSGTLEDLLKRGGDYRCSITSDVQGTITQGTVYVTSGGKNIRGDFSTMVPQVGMNVESHMIQRDGYVYVWSSMSPQGFKAKSTTTGGSGSAATSGSVSIDYSTRMTYHCDAWQVNNSLFTLPAGITFVE